MISQLKINPNHFNQETHKETVTRLQSQIKEARSVIEELESQSAIQIAEAKQQMHSTIEATDSELRQAKQSLQAVRSENEALTDRVNQLEQQG